LCLGQRDATNGCFERVNGQQTLFNRVAGGSLPRLDQIIGFSNDAFRPSTDFCNSPHGRKLMMLLRLILAMRQQC